MSLRALRGTPILRGMDWMTIGVMGAAIALIFLFKQIGLIRPEAARALLQQGATVIDVRTPAEYASGHLPRVPNIPLNELGQRIEKKVPDKNAAVLLHCLSGTRSGLGKRELRRLGYTNVHNLGSYARARKIVEGR